LKSAFPLAKLLATHVGMFKINTHLFTAEGPSAVTKLASLGPGVFLDLKFHDIPSVVGGAVRSAVALPGVRLVNLHALAGTAAMAAAAEAGKSGGGGAARPKVIAVTILTRCRQLAPGRDRFSDSAAGEAIGATGASGWS